MGGLRAARLDRRDLRAANEVIETLSTLRFGRAPVDGLSNPVRELLGAHVGLLYSYRVRPERGDLQVDFLDVDGLDHARILREWNSFLVGRGIDFCAFNPVRPEPRQRNRVVRVASTSRDPSPNPVRNDLYVRVGIGDYETVRVLLCERSSLLGWFGFMQPDVATPRQVALLRAITPATRRRFRVERMLRSAPAGRALLDVALEEVPAPAYVVTAAGQIAYANSLGRRRLAERGVATAVHSATRARDPSALREHRVVKVRSGNGQTDSLVIETKSPRRWTAAGHARRLGLTPAQTRVLEHVTRGLSNEAIATELAVGVRTIEAHLTAILEKAQVSSRAALLASFLERSE